MFTKHIPLSESFAHFTLMVRKLKKMKIIMKKSFAIFEALFFNDLFVDVFVYFNLSLLFNELINSIFFNSA